MFPFFFHYLSIFFCKIPVLGKEEITGPLKHTLLGISFLQTFKMISPLGWPWDKRQQSEVLFLLANSAFEFTTVLLNYVHWSSFFPSFLSFLCFSFSFFWAFSFCRHKQKAHMGHLGCVSVFYSLCGQKCLIQKNYNTAGKPCT